MITNHNMAKNADKSLKNARKHAGKIIYLIKQKSDSYLIGIRQRRISTAQLKFQWNRFSIRSINQWEMDPRVPIFSDHRMDHDNKLLLRKQPVAGVNQGTNDLYVVSFFLFVCFFSKTSRRRNIAQELSNRELRIIYQAKFNRT